MQTLKVVIQGRTALLMHNPASMLESKGAGAGRKQIPKPEDEAKASRYLMPDGKHLGLPTTAMRGSILAGAKGLRVGKQSLATLLPGCMTMEPEDGMLPLLRGAKPIKADDYEIDVRSAVVQKQRIIRARAKVPVPWKVAFEIRYDEKVLDDREAAKAIFRDVLERAGFYVGVLDYRPEKKTGAPGWFGKYDVVSVAPA